MVRKKSTDGGGESSEPGSGRGPPPSSERGGPLQQGSRGGGSQGGRGGGRQYEQGGRRGGYGGRGRGSTVAGSFLARSGITMVRKKSTDGGGESSEPGSGRGPPPSSERGGPLQQGSRGGGSQGGRGGGRQYEQGGRRGGYGGRGRGRGSTVAGSFLARSGITMVWKKRTDGGGESSEAGSGRGSPPSSERGGPPQQGSRGPLQQVSQEALQVLDLGRRQPIGHGLESWRGFDQNMSSTTFIEPLKVIDFVTQLLNRDVSSRPLSDADRVKIENSLRGLEVEVTNCGNMRPNYLPMEQYQQGGRGGGYGRCGRGGRGEDNENPSGESAGEDNENPSGESAHGTAIMGIRVTAHHTLVMAADGIGSIIEKGVIKVLGDDYVKLHCIGGTLIYGEAGYSGFGRDSKRKLKVTSRSLKRTPKYLEEQVEEVYQTLKSLKSSYENNYRCMVGSVDEDGYPRLWVMTPLEKIPVLDDTWTIGCGVSLANLEARLFSPDEHDVTDAFDICCRGIFRASIRNKAVGGKLLVATINVFYQITVYETNMKGLQNYFGLSDFQYKVLEQTEDLDWSRMPAFPAKTKEEKISFMESCRHDRKTQNFKKL